MKFAFHFLAAGHWYLGIFVYLFVHDLSGFFQVFTGLLGLGCWLLGLYALIYDDMKQTLRKTPFGRLLLQLRRAR